MGANETNSSNWPNDVSVVNERESTCRRGCWDTEVTKVSKTGCHSQWNGILGDNMTWIK